MKHLTKTLICKIQEYVTWVLFIEIIVGGGDEINSDLR